jgi:hypothetical protein
MMLMLKARFLLLSCAAVLLAGGVLASSASAAIEFKWRVGGAELKAGETRAATGGTDGKITDLHGTLAGASALGLATNVEVLPGSDIIGGVPGTGEGVGVFLGVTIDNPANCAVAQNGVAGIIQTTPQKSEIVEGAVGGVGNNEVDILTVPKTGTTYATFEFTGASCIAKGVVASISGSVLGLASPQKTEVLHGDVIGEANTKEYHNHAGEFKKAGLVFAGSAATITGLGLAILTSDQVFGAF